MLLWLQCNAGLLNLSLKQLVQVLVVVLPQQHRAYFKLKNLPKEQDGWACAELCTTLAGSQLFCEHATLKVPPICLHSLVLQ